MSGLLVVAVLAAVVLASGLVLQRLTVRSEIKMFGRRLSDPQAEPATGTGVEQAQPLSDLAVPAGLLPRSPLAPVAADPRPVAPGPLLPAAAVSAAAVAAGVQHPVGQTGLPPAPTGPARMRRQVVFHG